MGQNRRGEASLGAVQGRAARHGFGRQAARNRLNALPPRRVDNLGPRNEHLPTLAWPVQSRRTAAAIALTLLLSAIAGLTAAGGRAASINSCPNGDCLT